MHLRSTFSIEKHHTNIGLPWWLISKESACNAEASGGTSSIPSSGKSPGAGHGNPLQYSYLKNPMDRGAWWATIHDATKSGTLLKQLSTDAHKYYHLLYLNQGFPHSSVSKESACSAGGDPGSIPGLGRSSGEGNGNPFQYSCLENPMDRGAWRATVHGVARVRRNLVTKPPQPKSFPPFIHRLCIPVWNLLSYILWVISTSVDHQTIHSSHISSALLPLAFFFFFLLPSSACRILVLQPGIGPGRPSAVKALSLNHWTTRKFPGLHSLTDSHIVSKPWCFIFFHI